jgi:hypothetical protein
MQLGAASTESLRKKDIYASGILTGWNSRQVSPAAVAWPKSFLLGRDMECLVWSEEDVNAKKQVEVPHVHFGQMFGDL